MSGEWFSSNIRGPPHNQVILSFIKIQILIKFQ